MCLYAQFTYEKHAFSADIQTGKFVSENVEDQTEQVKKN